MPELHAAALIFGLPLLVITVIILSAMGVPAIEIFFELIVFVLDILA